MASTFTWLDYSEAERTRMQQFIDTFREADSRDELGIGSIRDGFADLLFPGISTVQTRARYFLFVPWLYRRMEEKRVPSSKIAQAARREEVQLITALLDSHDTDGVIGKRARSAIKRLPSNIYWRGLRAFGIRCFAGNQETYHRMFDQIVARLHERHQRTSDGDSLDDGAYAAWHSHLPPALDDFPKQATFRLEPHEATYLRERIMARMPRSLLAWLVGGQQPHTAIAFAWQHPDVARFPLHLQEQLAHAHNFSEIIHGAALLYNLMLAEKSKQSDLEDAYRDRIDEWSGHIEHRQEWDINRMWELLLAGGAGIALPTRTFASRWIARVRGMDDPAHIADDTQARDLLRRREQATKGNKARLHNQRALELWNGASGTARLDYRWSTAQAIVLDILHAIPEEERYAQSA